jgi:hypothetical protein
MSHVASQGSLKDSFISSNLKMKEKRGNEAIIRKDWARQFVNGMNIP